MGGEHALDAKHGRPTVRGPARLLAAPHKRHRLVNIWVDALVDRAAESGRFKQSALRVIRREGDIDGHRQAHDAAW